MNNLVVKQLDIQFKTLYYFKFNLFKDAKKDKNSIKKLLYL